MKIKYTKKSIKKYNEEIHVGLVDKDLHTLDESEIEDYNKWFKKEFEKEDKKYKLRKSQDFDGGFELVNTKDSTDRIPAADDEFFFGDTYTKKDFVMKNVKYVSHSGIGTMEYAFKN